MSLDYQFPENFWWGSAASATQTEGGENGPKGKNIWDKWYTGAANHCFFENIGPEVTSDFYNRFKEDIANMKKL